MELTHKVPITLRTPDVGDLRDVLDTLRAWHDGASPAQVHPGDVGWFWRFGAATTAASLRTWSRGDTVLALALLDGPDVARLAVAPGASSDEALAEQLFEDLSRPDRGVFPSGEVSVEARFGGALPALLRANEWTEGESWTPLRHDLSTARTHDTLRVEVVDTSRVRDRVAVQRAAFARSTFDEDCWRAMAEGPAYLDARCLVGYDLEGQAVAAATVWSAGPQRPGLLEPVGVHRDHQGRGYGTAITSAAVHTLREMGASSALVCTRSANVGAVATYQSAGFERLGESFDLRRSA
ncbi:MAG: GNAT family N-acetyltransferase [Acidobacteriota bacterium]|nr:GNAT family N-acetyltransferase [Acidobacteriota bacterium]MDE3043232.1 GNAT family N-acetyltransferase [Acidobacteriota bacterium]MDE3106554.1 GNAT family N-acetyltransferase [Acidobacteriota bacterium]MDE3222209.1 GNAT family N-acetyltransferase [Acidobacteriota bacterium]